MQASDLFDNRQPMGYHVEMNTVERITETIRRLPPLVQQEVLDYAESLAEKIADSSDANGHLQDDKNLELMHQAMADPQFLADLEEVAEDFRFADADEVVA